MMKIVIPLMLIAMALPPALAAGGIIDVSDLTCQDENRTHCPCHPQHCYLLKDILYPGSARAEAALAMEDADDDAISYPASDIHTATNATLVVSVTLQNGTPGEHHDVTVALEETLGITPRGGTSFTKTITQGGGAQTMLFGFRVRDVWGNGDYLFLHLTMTSENQTSDGYASIHVLNATSGGGGGGGRTTSITPQQALGGGIVIAIAGVTSGWIAGKRRALAGLDATGKKAGEGKS